MTTADTASGPAPQLRVRLPATLDAWERVEVTMDVLNTSPTSILPIELSLTTAAGKIGEWGIEGRI